MDNVGVEKKDRFVKHDWSLVVWIPKGKDHVAFLTDLQNYMQKKGYHFGSSVELPGEFHALQSAHEKDEKQLTMF